MSDQDHKSEPTDASREDASSSPTYTGAAVRGSIWSITQTIGSKGIMLVVQWLLATWLLPGDWGLAGIALAIAAALTICSPLPLVDLLVQRGVTKALPNILRIATVTSVLLAIVIACSSIWAGIRPGQDLKSTSGAPVTVGTTIEELARGEEIKTLVNEVEGSFEIRVDGAWKQNRLPKMNDISIKLQEYMAQLDEELNRSSDGLKLNVDFNEAKSKLRIIDETGAEIPIRTWSTAEGSALDALGFRFRSRPLTLLLLMLGVVPLIGLLKLPLAALLRLRLQFGAIAASNFGATIGGGFMAVTLAVLGAGSVALLMSQIAVPLITALIMIPFVGKIPRVPVEDREPVKPLLKDSCTLWLAQWVHSAGLLTPMLLLGYFASTEDAGFFYFATMLSIQLIALLSYNLSQAFTPIFSKLQESPERLATAYLRSTSAITAVTMLFLLCAGATAPIFIPQIYTDKWAPAVPILMILMVAQSFASSNSTSASLLKGSGRYKTWLFWQLAQSTTYVIAVALAAWKGSIITVAWVTLGQQAIFAPFGIYICSRGYASITDILRVHGVPFIAGSPLVIVGYISLSIGPSWVGLLVWCPLAGLVGGSIYVLILKYLDPTRFSEFVNIGKRLTGNLAFLKSLKNG
ncbi:MAG: oligosaccharide flippase family protein [Phycisphaerales bacterium]|nr:oligosaccharide flippase family protein [Phycisphaerales bacterium]